MNMSRGPSPHPVPAPCQSAEGHPGGSDGSRGSPSGAESGQER